MICIACKLTVSSVDSDGLCQDCASLEAQRLMVVAALVLVAVAFVGFMAWWAAS